MANIAKWVLAVAGIQNPLSTELNSLANNTMTVASGVISNDTALDMEVDLEINLGSLSPGTGATVVLYILEAIDGSNYPAQSDADLRLTTSQILAVIPIGTAGSTAQRVPVRNVLIPPGKFKIKLDNQTGATLAASGNTVKYISYDTNLNG